MAWRRLQVKRALQLLTLLSVTTEQTCRGVGERATGVQLGGCGFMVPRGIYKHHCYSNTAAANTVTIYTARPACKMLQQAAGQQPAPSLACPGLPPPHPTPNSPYKQLQPLQQRTCSSRQPGSGSPSTRRYPDLSPIKPPGA